MKTIDDNIIYIKVSDIDIDPDKRTWYYDGQGIRRDKETKEAKKIKSKSNITKDYPNHHDYYEY